MKRALLVGLALGFGLALVSMPGVARAGQPTGEFALMMRLNGSWSAMGWTGPGADGGTVGRIDGGPGECIKTQCYAAACVCPGALSCTCGMGQATTGEKLAADGVTFNCLGTSSATAGIITTAAYPGSLLPDGGAGAICDHWRGLQ